MGTAAHARRYLRLLSPRAYPKSLHRLQRMHLKIRIVIADHWSAVHGAGLIERYLGFLEQYSKRNRRVR